MKKENKKIDKKKIGVIIEILLFIIILGLITFFYYFNGKSKKGEQDMIDVGITKVTDKTFASEVIESNKPVIVEFSSNMCPPCLTMVPTLINIAKENKDIKVVTINTSDNDTKTISEKYNVDATPTIIIFDQGQVVETFIGATSEDTIMDKLK